MIKKPILFLFIALIFSSCEVMQSVVKSTFPYTTTVVIPKTSRVGVEQEITGDATSFDQKISRDGNNASKLNDVRIVSAKIQSKDPSDFNIGNLSMLKVYIAKEDGSKEVLVASRTDITPGVGNSMVLDIDNAATLDEHMREQKIKVRLVYKLRNHIDANANLRLALSFGANPVN
jgi:hypothetical protein